jgi:hypothetical protein
MGMWALTAPGPAPEATGVRETAAVSGFRMYAQVSRLEPGVSRRLRIRVRNPYSFAIVVHRIRTVVGNASGRCRADRLVVRRYRGRLRIQAKRVRRVRVRIRMRAGTPSACQAAVFPLRLHGVASR